jgi:sugar/nucleoside kinase (ribokinase family)
VKTLVVTRGESGALAVEDGAPVAVPAAPVERIVDTTGAGDLFAAGFITARCRGRELSACLAAGAAAAAQVISHFGARPQADLKQVVGL